MTIKWKGIAKTQEELGELQIVLGNLQCVLGKLHAYPDLQHPDEVYAGPLKTRLLHELADVWAAVEWFANNNLEEEDLKACKDRRTDKFILYTKWDTNGDHLVGVEVKDE